MKNIFLYHWFLRRRSLIPRGGTRDDKACEGHKGKKWRFADKYLYIADFDANRHFFPSLLKNDMSFRKNPDKSG